MKKRYQILIAVLAAVLLCAGSVAGTMAYLTASDKVTNTFTVGKVTMTLDEADVDENGVKDGDTRVKTNSYHLVPGKTYTKDPTVHVGTDSDDSYVFVKVENGIAAYETTETGKTVAEQIAANGWTLLDGTTNVYYKEWTKGSAADLKIFDSFTMADDAQDKDGWSSIGADTKIDVTGYAVQKEGFATAKAAWDSTFGK